MIKIRKWVQAGVSGVKEKPQTPVHTDDAGFSLFLNIIHILITSSWTQTPQTWSWTWFWSLVVWCGLLLLRWAHTLTCVSPAAVNQSEHFVFLNLTQTLSIMEPTAFTHMEANANANSRNLSPGSARAHRLLFAYRTELTHLQRLWVKKTKANSDFYRNEKQIIARRSDANVSLLAQLLRFSFRFKQFIGWMWNKSPGSASALINTPLPALSLK